MSGCVTRNKFGSEINSRSKSRRRRNQGEIFKRLTRPLSPFHHYLEILQSEIDGDGQQVLVLILNCPDELTYLLRKGTVQAKKKHLKKYLKTVYHWDNFRIRQAFREIRRALKE